MTGMSVAVVARDVHAEVARIAKRHPAASRRYWIATASASEIAATIRELRSEAKLRGTQGWVMTGGLCVWRDGRVILTLPREWRGRRAWQALP